MNIFRSDRALRKIIFFMCIGILLVDVSGCAAIKEEGKKMLRGRVDPASLDTGLPVITISTHSGRAVASKEQYISADIGIADSNNSLNNIQTSAEIRGRGNTSWNAPKKSYRLKFFEKTALFGYEKAKSWVLLANFQDPTMILNSTAFELGRRFGVPFTPHYTHVELVLNGRYEGSYVLTEQIQVGRGRVEIDEDAGFLAELDGHYDEDPKFRTALLDMPVMIKSPEDMEEPSGYDFVKNTLNELEAALFNGSVPDAAYRDLIDMDVFIDYIMINEITRNVDVQKPHSVFLYRDGKKDSRIGLGPLWDFDWGFDYADSRYFVNTAGMFYNTVFREGPGQRFFSRFFDDPGFRTAYKNRWNEKYQEIIDMEQFIDEMVVLLGKSQEANSKVWWWKKVDYAKEIERMKQWWKDRTAYLHTEINTF